jgi:long-chain acyl-CoA synthetase
MVLVPRVLEKVAVGVQDKFSSGSLAVKVLSTLFTKTSKMRATHRKIAEGLVIADKPPNPGTRLASRAIVAALSPFNFVGDKLVWSKVKDGFGGRIKVIISGGSALAGGLETFYETAGLTICVGYGLTECSPLIAHRRSDENLVAAGCAGKATYDTELRIVDHESLPGEAERKALADGEPGLVVARGPQIMKGYYKNPKATAKAIDIYGWFDTGDLGRINPATGDLILTGRAKDTIVLSNGENIEPAPIEDSIVSKSPLIEQCMLVGQDGRRLVAIAVLSPSELANAGFLSGAEGEKLQEANEKVNDPQCSDEDCETNSAVLREASQKLRGNSELQNALLADVKRATSDFRQWEQVSDLYLTLEPFAMVNGLLTQSYKVKRNDVMERYEKELPT